MGCLVAEDSVEFSSPAPVSVVVENFPPLVAIPAVIPKLLFAEAGLDLRSPVARWAVVYLVWHLDCGCGPLSLGSAGGR